MEGVEGGVRRRGKSGVRSPGWVEGGMGKGGIGRWEGWVDGRDG